MEDKHPQNMSLSEIDKQIDELRHIQWEDSPAKFYRQSVLEMMWDMLSGKIFERGYKNSIFKSPAEEAREDTENLAGDMRRVGRDMRIGMLLHERKLRLAEKEQQDNPVSE